MLFDILAFSCMGLVALQAFILVFFFTLRLQMVALRRRVVVRKNDEWFQKAVQLATALKAQADKKAAPGPLQKKAELAAKRQDQIRAQRKRERQNRKK